MKFRVEVSRHQPLALPALVDDWIGPDHLVRVIDRLVDDLPKVEAKYHDHGTGVDAETATEITAMCNLWLDFPVFSSKRPSSAISIPVGKGGTHSTSRDPLLG